MKRGPGIRMFDVDAFLSDYRSYAFRLVEPQSLAHEVYGTSRKVSISSGRF
jgi:hypothetical protein